MSQLPAGTLGDAIGVLIYTFICLFSNILLVWLHWVRRERLTYVALIAYFALLCTISSIIQQIYNYTLWNDLMWAQLYYIKANYENADVIFNNGNFGFMKVMANIRLFCYIMEASYLLSYSTQITLAVYGFWPLRQRRTEQKFALISKIVPLVLAGITLGLLQTPPVQSSFLAYMLVANAQSVTSCAVSILLILSILWKYIETTRFRRQSDSTSPFRGWWVRFGSKSSSGASSSGDELNRAQQGTFNNSWLVSRLSIAIILVSIFIFASVATHLPQRDDVMRDAQADSPDLGPGRARSNIIGYMPGVTPGLAIWIVFGLTGTFRQLMYDKFVPRRWREKWQKTEPHFQGAWLPSDISSGNTRTGSNLVRLTTDAELQLDDLGPNSKKREPTDLNISPLFTRN